MSSTYSDHFKKIKSQKKNSFSVTKKKILFPWKPIILSLGGAALCFLALYLEDESTSIKLPKIKFSFFESSLAQDSNSGSASTPANKNETKVSTSTEKYPEIEEKHLVNLAERKRELDEREQELMKLEKEVEEKNHKINERIIELKKIREEIAAILKSKVDEDDKKIDQLVDVYSSMRPGQAAKVFEDLDEELVVRVLTKMKKKSAAEILNLMKVEKAKKITELYTGFDRSPTNNKP